MEMIKPEELPVEIEQEQQAWSHAIVQPTQAKYEKKQDQGNQLITTSNPQKPRRIAADEQVRQFHAKLKETKGYCCCSLWTAGHVWVWLGFFGNSLSLVGAGLRHNAMHFLVHLLILAFEAVFLYGLFKCIPEFLGALPVLGCYFIGVMVLMPLVFPIFWTASGWFWMALIIFLLIIVPICMWATYDLYHIYLWSAHFKPRYPKYHAESNSQTF